MLATTHRALLNGATMLGQSKTAFQAEIDSACELIDFWRFNVAFGERIMAEQPASGGGAWNRMDHRPLEGFVYAVTPFNFTAIGGNLPTAPALMGNTAVWKPSHTALLSNYYIYKLLETAGLPPGVVNFVPSEPVMCTGVLVEDPNFAGVHFTGSTAVFRQIWHQVASRLDKYVSYPRIVGETGGKDFVIAHPSADPQAVAVGLVRGAFEYQGQKCSAASRAYIPDTLWPEVRDSMVAMMKEIRMGDVADFRNFMGAVIDQRAFQRISGYLDAARSAPGVKIIAGGGADDKKGWFIEPTLVQTEDPGYRMMCEELFGPVLTTYVYPAAKWRETLELVNRTGP
jgi:1-pyrroline-5-carboxylate dehydrogenase